jgi:predicted NUDIX family NTP pyrophosphohydrolase
MSKKGSFKKVAAVLAVVVVVAVLVVGTLSAGGYEPPKVPKIVEFTASPSQLDEAGETTLGWNVQNAVRIEITGIEKQPDCLPLVGTMPVLVTATTEYTLKAFDKRGNSVTKTLTVTVGPVVPPMTIDYFKSDKTNVVLGDTVMLSWKTTGATEVSIVGIEKIPDALALEGTLEAVPMATTVYTLEAKNAKGEIKKASLTVVVEEENKVEITSFTASAPKNGKCYLVGEQVNFKWVTKNAQRVELELKDVNGKVVTLKNRPLTGEINHFPNVDTTYTLKAYDVDGKMVSKQIVIHVN